MIGPFKARRVVAASYRSLTLKAAIICLPDNNLGQSPSPSYLTSTFNRSAYTTTNCTPDSTTKRHIATPAPIAKTTKLQTPILRRICPLLLYNSVVLIRSKMESLGDSVCRAPAPHPVNLKSKQSDFLHSTDEENTGHGASDHQETERSKTTYQVT